MNGWMNKWWDDRSRDPCKHIECSEGNGRKKNIIDSHPFALLSFVSTCYPCWLSALASLKENKSCQWKLLEVRFIIPRSSLRIRTRKSRNNFSNSCATSIFLFFCQHCPFLFSRSTLVGLIEVQKSFLIHFWTVTVHDNSLVSQKRWLDHFKILVLVSANSFFEAFNTHYHIKVFAFFFLFFWSYFY